PGVDGVRVRLLVADLPERLHERLAGSLELAIRDAGHADGHAVGRLAGPAHDRRDRRETVGREDLDARAEPGAEVLDQLAAVLADQAAEEYAGGTGLLDLHGDRLVARGLPVPGREARDRDPE